MTILLVGSACSIKSEEEEERIRSRKVDFRLELIAKGMISPWSMDWLPNGSALISDRKAGRLYLLPEGDTLKKAITNAPRPYTFLDSGMREVLIPENYADAGWIYLSYDSLRMDSLSTLVVERAKLVGGQLRERSILFVAEPWLVSGYHYGGRLLWQDGYLFITVGDRHFRDSAQVLHTHNGKILRIHEDGQIPIDNPFVDFPNAKPEIWSYGHRNPQGIAFDPDGQLWAHEHGPKGGDEINRIQKGKNYGWPVICHGEEYEGGPVGNDRRFQEGLEQPFRYYSPAVAPSGLCFYTGPDFPEWQHNLFFGAMSQRNLYRLGFSKGKLREEERLLNAQNWRIRFLAQGPDQLLYFGTDKGQIWRIVP